MTVAFCLGAGCVVLAKKLLERAAGMACLVAAAFAGLQEVPPDPDTGNFLEPKRPTHRLLWPSPQRESGGKTEAKARRFDALACFKHRKRFFCSVS